MSRIGNGLLLCWIISNPKKLSTKTRIYLHARALTFVLVFRTTGEVETTNL